MSPIRLELTKMGKEIDRGDGPEFISLTDMTCEELDEFTEEVGFNITKGCMNQVLAEMMDRVEKMPVKEQKLWNRALTVNIRNLAIMFGITGR